MESRKGSRNNSFKVKREAMDEEYETPKFSKGTTAQSSSREDLTQFPDTRSIKEKVHSSAVQSKEYNSPFGYTTNEYYKRNSNKKAYKCNWTIEEDDTLTKMCKEQTRSKNWKRIAENFPGKTDIQCMQRWEKFLNPENAKGKKRPWTEEEDLLVLKLVEKNGPQKWTFIADHLPGRIGKQCRERWHNHLNPKIKKSSWSDEEEWLLFLHHKAIGNKWADIAKSLPGRTDNSIKNHWNSSMKKRIPELLNRFLKMKEAGGLDYLETTDDLSRVERELLDILFRMGDNDFHSIHGIMTDSKSCDTYSKGNGDKKTSIELKAFNSLSKISGDAPSRSRNSSSRQEYLDASASPKDSVSMRKLMEEVTFNPKTCDDIRNYIKEHNLDMPPIESLDLKNPEHIKLLDQLYNPKVLKSVLKKNHYQQQESKKLNESSNSHHSNSISTNETSSQKQCCSCSRKYHSHKASNTKISKCSKKSNNYHDSSSGKPSNHHYDENSYYTNSNTNDHHHTKHNASNSKNDFYKYINNHGNFTSSPLLPKESGYLFASPVHRRTVVKKEDSFPEYHPEGEEKYEEDTDMYDRVDDSLPSFELSKGYGYNTDNYLFGSPMPTKKVKVEETDHTSLGLLDFDHQQPSLRLSATKGGKSKNSEKKNSLSLSDWMNHGSDENQHPNLSNALLNFSASGKKKGNSSHLLNFSGSKENYNPFYSPRPNKYESPSRLIAFCTPDRHQNHGPLASARKLHDGVPSGKSPSLFISKGFVPYDKTSILKL